MAVLKTKANNQSVEKFLNSVKDEAQREDCFTVLRLMGQATKAQPRMWGSSIVGFGSYHYQYASGHEGDCFVTGFSPRKDSLSLYIMAGNQQFPELLAKLGKYKTGVSCLYIKRLADVDTKVLQRLIEASVKKMKTMYPPA